MFGDVMRKHALSPADAKDRSLWGGAKWSNLVSLDIAI
jgi:hypothetical protein